MSSGMFQRVYSEGVLERTEIWVDTQTGVHYLFHKDGNAAGLTPLLGSDGRPIVRREGPYEE